LLKVRLSSHHKLEAIIVGANDEIGSSNLIGRTLPIFGFESSQHCFGSGWIELKNQSSADIDACLLKELNVGLSAIASLPRHEEPFFITSG